MADDVMDKAAADAKPVPQKGTGNTVVVRPETRADRARRLAYRSRFAAFYVLLAVVAGAGVGALLVLVGQGAPTPRPPGRSGSRTGAPSGAPRRSQTTSAIPTGFRAETPLVSVTSGPPTTTFSDGTTFLVQTIARYPDTTDGRAETDDIDTFGAGSTVMYTLCGTAVGCVIAEGKPSLERGQLLRRMALELSLYSFKYLDGIDSVLVLFPPAVARPAVERRLSRAVGRSIRARPAAPRVAHRPTCAGHR